MSDRSEAAASDLASSVLPTPAGPSMRMGLSSFTARYTTVARRRSQTYSWPTSFSLTSSMVSNKMLPFAEINALLNISLEIPGASIRPLPVLSLGPDNVLVVLAANAGPGLRSSDLVAVGAAAHLGRDAPDVLPVAVGRLDVHAVVHAVAQDLLRRADGKVARVTGRTQVAHHVLGHLLQLVVVGLDGRVGLALVEAFAHPGLRVLPNLAPVLRAPAILEEPDDGLYGRVGRLRDAHALGVDAHRFGDVGVLLGGRGLVIGPYPGKADAVVQPEVDVVVGADGVLERVQDAEQTGGERLGRRVLRPDHTLHRLVVLRVVGRLAQVLLGQPDRRQGYRGSGEMLHTPDVTFGGVGHRVEARVRHVLGRLRHAEHRVVDRQRRYGRPVETDPLVRRIRRG